MGGTNQSWIWITCGDSRIIIRSMSVQWHFLWLIKFEGASMKGNSACARLKGTGTREIAEFYCGIQKKTFMSSRHNWIWSNKLGIPKRNADNFHRSRLGYAAHVRHWLLSCFLWEIQISVVIDILFVVMKGIITLLEGKGIRPTSQRIAVAQFILKSNAHPSSGSTIVKNSNVLS